jgi:hypothetical protein
MGPQYAHELADRALKNYTLVRRREDEGDDGAFGTTALISALLLVVVSPQEHIIREAGQRGFPDVLRTFAWPNEVRPYVSGDAVFCEFLTALRNALSHDDFGFLVSKENGEVVGAYFSVKLGNESKCVGFFEEDLYTFAQGLVAVYREMKVSANAKGI